MTAREMMDVLFEPPPDPHHGRIVMSPAQYARLKTLRGYDARTMDPMIVLPDGTHPEERWS